MVALVGALTQQSALATTAQTITFGTLAGKTYGAAAFTVSATASSGLTVAFTSATTSVCTSTGTNGTTITLVGAGTCTIDANQAGNATYSAAPQVAQSFAVAKEAQTITFGTIANKPYGTNFTLSATASSALAVTFTSATTSTCTVSGTTVTPVALGTCTIDANQAGNANFNAATQVAQSTTITQAAQTITFATIANQLMTASPFTLTGSTTSGLTLTYTSSTTPVCTVAGSVVTFVTPGTCTITASQTGNTDYSAATAVARSFTVAKASQTITFGTIASQLMTASPFTLTGTTTSGLVITYTSSTTPVCTVSGSAVTFVTPGTCTITASQAGNGNYNAATSVPESFTVAKAAQTITFGTIANKPYGTPFTVAATSTSGLTVAFTSATTTVCTVSGTTVTPVTLGTCTIDANQAGNTSYNAATQVAQSTTITQAPQTITFNALANQSYGVAPLTLAATSTSNLTVAFTSATTAVCTVSGTTLTLVTPGTCTVNANQAGNTDYAAATQVARSFTVTPEAQTITFGALSNQVYGAAPLTVSATSSSGLTVTFTSTTTPVCTVAGTTVTLVTPGTCTINANQAGNTTYSAAPVVAQSFTVAQEAQTISFATIANQIFGEAPFTVSATSSSGLTVAFTSSTTSVCTVSGTTVTLIAAGSCTMNANQAGNTYYAPATQQSQTITVAGDPIKISLNIPIENQQLEAPVNLTMSATASDSTGTITQVAFYNSGTLMGTATQPPYSFEVPNAPVGIYEITAVATDSNHLTSTSSTIYVAIAANSGAEQIYYINADQLNTPRLLTNSDGIPVWTWDGEAFGNTPPNTNPSGLGSFTFNLRFTGQYYDAETGLNQNYYRDYDPTSGRYIESDPIGLKGGINTFAYVRENPLRGTDPYGLAEICKMISEMEWVAINRGWKIVGYKNVYVNEFWDAVFNALSGVKVPGFFASEVIPILHDLQLEQEHKITSRVCTDSCTGQQISKTKINDEAQDKYRENWMNPGTEKYGNPTINIDPREPTIYTRWGVN